MQSSLCDPCISRIYQRMCYKVTQKTLVSLYIVDFTELVARHPRTPCNIAVIIRSSKLYRVAQPRGVDMQWITIVAAIIAFIDKASVMAMHMTNVVSSDMTIATTFAMATDMTIAMVFAMVIGPISCGDNPDPSPAILGARLRKRSPHAGPSAVN